ncbi:hypothetical protein DSL64_02050 [Dyadobacter luteus]|uniref:DUF4097 domain-containing protein n=1 Tax=Dyadobacter luteus TaxID=2259619 RepID=A0A3D8YHQ4_9BACT|nr:hypothetical protein [Dyadobacter luteus]REA64356.1 hypothetical protein DSL64_02050 [Dyadobacter luteus]
MKKLLTSIVISVSLFSAAYAQDRQFKLSKKAGRLILNISDVSVEGYDGSEIIFSAPQPKEKDEKAKGLTLLSGSGYSDNTGLNLSVRDNGSNVEVDYVGKQEKVPITVKVPNTMSVKVSATGAMSSDGIVYVKDFKGESEINTIYNSISLQNVTGPINAKTLYGELNAKFASSLKGPISLVAVNKYIDVSIPADLKANVNLSTSFGNIYAAEGLNIVRETAGNKQAGQQQTASSDSKEWSRSTSIKGRLNGGGLDLILNTNNKIYLRTN